MNHTSGTNSAHVQTEVLCLEDTETTSELPAGRSEDTPLNQTGLVVQNETVKGLEVPGHMQSSVWCQILIIFIPVREVDISVTSCEFNDSPVHRRNFFKFKFKLSPGLEDNHCSQKSA